MRSTRVLTTSVVGLAALLAACADTPTSAPTVTSRVAGLGPAVSAALTPSTNALQLEEFRVCKVGSSATFSYTVDYRSNGVGTDESGTFSLNSGECVSVAQRGGAGSSVSVTETGAPAGYQLDRIELLNGSTTTVSPCGTATVTNSTLTGPTVTGSTSGSSSGTCRGGVATFYNELIPVGEIGDFVWEDANNNGIQDSGEAGIPGVTMTLGGDASATTTTDANGKYLFSGLSAGNYTVTVGAAPAGYTASPANQGSDDTIDSDGTAAVSVTLPANNSVNYTIDFGFVPPPVIVPLQGRMTGGGFKVGAVKVTGGFTLHCDIKLSNNLEINWGKDKWHLDKPITAALCIDDPNVDPTSPVAPFDTFIGEGYGRLNGVDGSFIKFTLVDAGEPGRDDMVRLQIFPPGGGAPVLDLPLSKLDIGNIQAHYDQPHGQKKP